MKFTINDGTHVVSASSPEAAVAKDLRDAGYRARVVGDDVLVESTAEHLVGVQDVYGGGRRHRVTVKVGGESGAAKITSASEARAVLARLEGRRASR